MNKDSKLIAEAYRQIQEQQVSNELDLRFLAAKITGRPATSFDFQGHSEDGYAFTQLVAKRYGLDEKELIPAGDPDDLRFVAAYLTGRPATSFSRDGFDESGTPLQNLNILGQSGKPLTDQDDETADRTDQDPNDKSAIDYAREDKAAAERDKWTQGQGVGGKYHF